MRRMKLLLRKTTQDSLTGLRVSGDLSHYIGLWIPNFVCRSQNSRLFLFKVHKRNTNHQNHELTSRKWKTKSVNWKHESECLTYLSPGSLDCKKTPGPRSNAHGVLFKSKQFWAGVYTSPTLFCRPYMTVSTPSCSGRQAYPGKKQCLYGSSMSNNFLNCKLEFLTKGIYWPNLRVLYAVEFAQRVFKFPIRL